MSQPLFLEDRGVVEVAGADAARFLHNLVTNEILKLGAGEARFCALLTPQGKILVDFFVFAVGEGAARRYFLDCPKALEKDLIQRLGMYRLRSAVTIVSRSDEISVFALARPPESSEGLLALARDPRAEALGWRALSPRGAFASFGSRRDYDASRVAAGVPEGGVDFAYGDAFPHEANMDRLSGVDFGKGCYVGQEVVARTQHRGLARRRVARYRAKGEAPPPGTPVRAGGAELGVTGSSSGEIGLALIRIDRLADARAAGAAIEAAGVPLQFASAD